ncbi:MAG: NADH:flavin oxidoreductase [Anaerolineae bacterium]|nr:NADH:flavin oxidoreductase [Anaerolineae bacterium]NUQ03043.1 NADH:flavin oxidoreductase [Anaerolineae bacterium]
MTYKRVAQLRTPADFHTYLEQIGAALEFDEQVEHGSDSPLAQPFTFDGVTIGNRFTILPMEGWDAEPDGQPSALVRRRWERFGSSGAKLIFGGEATAVRRDGRANPNQLVIGEETLERIADLRTALVQAHAAQIGDTSDLLVGLQLTHSGRFARPNDKKRLEPRILYHHPLLDAKYKLASDYPVMTDDEIDALIADFVAAAVRAQQAGFAFVDVKHCHGYLGHEFLSAVERPGRYGGSFENRTRFLREIVAGIRRDAPGLLIGVRLSAFDWLPFRPGADSAGEPESWSGSYPYAFGGDGSGVGIDLTETHRFLSLLEDLNIRLVCLTAGSPYYNPHIQRPALFPPSDGYQPPEDPLRGVARQIGVVAELKRTHPNLFLIGSGYSYLQDWLPNVAQRIVRTGMADSIGLGRMVLSYPQMPADILAGRPLQRKQICRTFSDCTTAPRGGMISGCYPLDGFYKTHPEAAQLEALKHPDRRQAHE